MDKGLHTPIFDHGDCLSESVLLDYAHNKLSLADRNKVEKHLLDCELCSDALEGLSLLKNQESLTKLKTDVVKKFGSTHIERGRIIKLEFRTGLAIAASIAVLVVAVFFFRSSLENEKTVADVMTDNPKKELPPPQPLTALPEASNEEDKKVEQPIERSAEKTIAFGKITDAPKKSEENKITTNSKSADDAMPPPVQEEEVRISTSSSPKGDVVVEDEALSSRNIDKEKESAASKPEIGYFDDDNASKNLDSKLAKDQLYKKEGKAEETTRSKKKASKSNMAYNEPASINKSAAPQAVPGTITQAGSGASTEVIIPDETAGKVSESQNEEIFTIVEEMPTYPGGEEAMRKFIKENIKYPASAKAKNIQGTSYVTFIVGKDGSITDIKILRGIPGGPECDSEAQRVVKSMPKWKPGRQNGRPVKVSFNLPIKFSL